jgi:hypothetical protein
VKHERIVHEAKITQTIGVRAGFLAPGVAAGVALVLALTPRVAQAEENAAPLPPPPRAAAATGPSPKAADAPKGTKASAAQAPQPPAPLAAAPPADPTSAAPAAAAATPTKAPAAPAEPTADPGAPPKVEGGPPPVYFVEPAGAEPATAPPPGAPPPPSTVIYEPPLPPEPSNLVPETAFWAGARLSWFVPFGNLWVDAFDSRAGLYYRRRLFEDYASSGPAFEFDAGVRLARRYTVFALMEHAFVGSGSLDDNAYGGQSRGRTSLYGAAVRFSTEPSSFGLLLELGLGYREFRASWNDGTELSFTGGWLDARIGVGADVRVNKYFSLSPMLVFGGGTFGKATWSGPGRSGGDALGDRDALGQYGTFSAQLGGHFDIH